MLRMVTALALAGAALLLPAEVRAEDDEERPLTVGLSVAAGMQYDSRPCVLAGHEGTTPDVDTCVMMAGGADLSLLWRYHIGGVIGLYGVSGQSVKTLERPGIPDRISVPIALEVRPLSFLVPQGDRSYTGRLMSGLALRAGPSVEVVRTGSDSEPGLGAYFALLGEVPLSSARRHGVALRAGLSLLVAPRIALNDGMVRSQDFDACTDPGCTPLPERHQGHGLVAQTYVGFIYYP